MNKSVVLVILDGWGWGKSWGGNAITISKTDNFNQLLRTYPFTTLGASGASVGLPGHEVGNSEVGHMNIGAGNIVEQDIAKINRTISDGSFYENPVLKQAMLKSKQNGTSLHLTGIISDGGIHSHIVHLFALIKLAKIIGHERVFIHGFTDGRDTDPYKGLEFVNKIEILTKALNTGKIATILGRTYLDRKGNWQKTKVAYEAMTQGIGETYKSALSAISASYKNGQTDEYITPKIIDPEGQIKNNDTVIFFNYRSDRTRQLTQAFLEPGFDKFPRPQALNLDFVTFIPYGIELELQVKASAAFQTTSIDKTIGAFFSENNMTQFHLAETEKYAHVTFFINGNRNEPYQGEDRLLIPSPNVKSYDLTPSMSALKITEELKKHIERGTYGFIICNYANGDMVGHTGNFNAAVKAVECLDQQIKEIAKVCIDRGVPLVISADHGNIEQMVDPATGNADTEHTKNPVPLVIVSNQKYSLRADGKLANIAPTCLQLAGFEVPSYFDQSLITGVQTLKNG